ncbi:winged helix-turn-helix transcriptional regulator [Quadrisphaera sp. RL12-1S]|nr:winged helix-turn-helix transcriptional regulator [Quadrisphaera sp. RL12-1S]
MVGDVATLTSLADRSAPPAAGARVLARFGHALSDPTRARLLLALRQAPGYPAELADELGVSRQNLSNHLACLRGCGLVVASQEGRRVRYALADPALGHALEDLLSAVAAVDLLAEEGHR